MRLTSILLGRSKSMELILDSTVADVLAATRYSAKQWKRFKAVTSSVAQTAYMQQQSDAMPATWISLPASAKQEIAESVKEQLRKEGVPVRPAQKVLHWRMHRVFKNMRKMWAARQAHTAYTLQATRLGHRGAELDSHLWRFKHLVREHMGTLGAKYPRLTFKELPERERQAVRESVNAQLREEGIPQAGQDLLDVQMERALMKWKVRRNREARERAEKEEEGRVEKEG